MSKKKFYIAAGYSGSVASMLVLHGFTQTNSIEDCDFLVLTGGSDISPSLYGETNVKSHPMNERDQKEMADIQLALKLDKPMCGVCRGAQMLNVVSGGSMWQDVNNHRHQHEIVSDYPVENQKLIATSIHHQMMIPSGNYYLIAYVENHANVFTSDKGTFTSHNHKDPEVVYYPETKSLCIQGHPEFTADHSEYQKYCINLLNLMLSGKMDVGLSCYTKM